MVHLTLAVADFMAILIGAALAAAASAGVVALVVVACLGATLWGARRLVRAMLRR